MKATIKLFKAVPIKTKRKKKASKELLAETIKRGFIFSQEVIHNYSDQELNELVKVVEQEVGLTPEKMNASFHKSWQKVRDAPMIQLIMEQILHYITTYGFEELGIYDENSVYIPAEKLEIPAIDNDKIKLTVIKGYTKDELKNKLMKLLATGIALKEDTITDILEIIELVGVTNEEIDEIKNREVKITLYDKLKTFPKNPVEFLRYLIYKTTDKTLLIKNDEVIKEIKEGINNGQNVEGLFNKYNKKHSLKKLGEIFYRFKPLFLAFKEDDELKHIINKIRKLAKEYHRPMKADFLNTVTARVNRGETITKKKMIEELSKVNIFRRIRLAQALKFRVKDTGSIMYRVRNGRSYATSFNFENKNAAKRILDIIIESIANGLTVKDKKIYVPEGVVYTLPSTEKQFVGSFPVGSYITVPSDMVVGVQWSNVKSHRIDLDLKMMNKSGMFGWDASYRQGSNLLFSGDVTDAPKDGASELFYVKKQGLGAYLFTLNYYNFYENVEVPFKIFVGSEKITREQRNYMIDPNNVVAIVKSSIKETQKVLGLLVSQTNNCRFYFSESGIGNSISSSNKGFMEHARKFMLDSLTNPIKLTSVLEKAGAIMVDEKDCDINLSPENLDKTTILNLIKGED